MANNHHWYEKARFDFLYFQVSSANKHIYCSQSFGYEMLCRSIKEALKAPAQTTIRSFSEFFEWCCLCPFPNPIFPLVKYQSEERLNWLCMVADRSLKVLTDHQSCQMFKIGSRLPCRSVFQDLKVFHPFPIGPLNFRMPHDLTNFCHKFHDR